MTLSDSPSQQLVFDFSGTAQWPPLRERGSGTLYTKPPILIDNSVLFIESACKFTP